MYGNVILNPALVTLLLLRIDTVIKATFRRKHLTEGLAYSFRGLVRDYQDGVCDDGQAGMMQAAVADSLHPDQQAGARIESKTRPRMGFGNLKAHSQ